MIFAHELEEWGSLALSAMEEAMPETNRYAQIRAKEQDKRDADNASMRAFRISIGKRYKRLEELNEVAHREQDHFWNNLIINV